MADIAKVLRGIERCKKCTFPNTMDPEGTKAYLECEYTIGLYCGRDRLEMQMEELLKEQNQRIWELLTEKEKLEEDIKKQISEITDLEDTIRQLNQHIKDLSEYMTPYGMVKDLEAYDKLLKEQDAKTFKCKMCGHRLQTYWNWCPWCRWKVAEGR